MQRGRPPLPRLTGWIIAVVATLAMTVSYVDRQALSHLAPTVRDALHLDHQQYGTVTGAFSLSYLIGAPLAGWLLDRIGARRGLAASIVIWSAVSALHALAPSFAVLILLRLALGAAEAPSFPGATQTVRRALPASDRSMGYSLIFTGSSLGAMIAAPLAIGLKVHFGWRLAFVGTSLCGLLWLPLWLVATGGSRKAALEDAGVERSHEESVPWREVLREPAILRAVVLVFAAAPALMFILTWYAQLLVEHFHQRQDDLWRYLWVPPLMLDLGAVGFGWLSSVRDRTTSDRERGRSRMDLVIVGSVLSASLALVPLVDRPVSAVVLGGASMMGGGALYVLATADMLRRVSPRIVSRASGCTAAAQSLAHILFAPAIGAVLDRAHTYAPVLVVLGLISAPGVVAWSLWPMRSPK